YGNSRVGGFLRETFRAQLKRDTHGTELARELTGSCLGIARFGQLTALRQIVEQRRKVVVGGGMSGELARELGAGMFAAGEEPDGALPQGGRLARHPLAVGT